MLHDIIKKEPLTLSHIRLLHPHTCHYVIPSNQLHSKMYGIIAFNDCNREGAYEEAEILASALQSKNISVSKTVWSTTYELMRALNNSVNAVSDDCSLLVISLMSHGRKGVICGAEDTEMEINDIWHILTHKLPETVPLVSCIYFLK